LLLLWRTRASGPSGSARAPTNRAQWANDGGVYPLLYPRLKPENLSIHGELAVSAMVKRSGFFTSDQPKPSGRQGRRGLSVLMRRVSTILHSEVGEALGDQRCSDGLVHLISLPVPRYRLLSSNMLMAFEGDRATPSYPERPLGRSWGLWRGRFEKKRPDPGGTPSKLTEVCAWKRTGIELETRGYVANPEPVRPAIRSVSRTHGLRGCRPANITQRCRACRTGVCRGSCGAVF
jgi:hypothetical protein